jgi:hypothetical protein
VAAVARAGSAEPPEWLVHAPALAAAALVLAPLEALAGKLHGVPHAVVFIAFLPLAAAAVPLIARERRLARVGLRSLALVAGAAPLALAPTWPARELYLVTVSGALVLVALVKQNDRLLAHGAVGLAVFSVHRFWAGATLAEEEILFFGSVLSLAVALRIRDSKLAAAVALAACFAPVGVVLLEQPTVEMLLVAFAASSSAAFLGWRQARPLVWKCASVSVVALLLRRFATELGTGPGLIALAFVSIGAGTGIALRRERLAREQVPA